MGLRVQSLYPGSDPGHPSGILKDARPDIGTSHFNDDRFSTVQARTVDLCYRGRCEGLVAKGGEQDLDRMTERGFNALFCNLRLKRRHLILQFGELIGDILREHIA